LQSPWNSECCGAFDEGAAIADVELCPVSVMFHFFGITPKEKSLP
jgi:hypothetical protein